MDHRLITTGMPVHSADGQEIGRVVECKPDTFKIGKGFLPDDFEATYDQVVLVRNGHATLGTSGDELKKTIH